MALSLGVPWIDLKNPALGSLGCPDTATARAVLDVVAANQCGSGCQTSVALGELATLDIKDAVGLIRLFPIVKVGLAGFAPTPIGTGALDKLDQLAQLQHSPGQLVVAAYADYQRASAPPPETVIELAGQVGARYVLVDTFMKDGLGLFHWRTAPQITALGVQARRIGAELVVAGSLSSADWPMLSEAEPAIIGVRGGVCTEGRTSQLCPDRIAKWLAWSQG